VLTNCFLVSVANLYHSMFLTGIVLVLKRYQRPPQPLIILTAVIIVLIEVYIRIRKGSIDHLVSLLHA